MRWAHAFALVAWERLARPRGRTGPFRALGYPPAPNRSYLSNEQFTGLTPLSQQEQAGFTWPIRRRDEATRLRMTGATGEIRSIDVKTGA